VKYVCRKIPEVYELSPYFHLLLMSMEFFDIFEDNIHENLKNVTFVENVADFLLYNQLYIMCNTMRKTIVQRYVYLT